MNYCIDCNNEIENTDFHAELCKKCWTDEWDKLIGKSPMISPEMLNKKVKLDFMVDKLDEHAYVENPVKVIITNPNSLHIKTILGLSGLSLAKAGVPFMFMKPLADELIKLGVMKEYKYITDLNKKTWGFLDNKEDVKYD